MLQSLGLRGRFAKRNFKTYSSKSSLSNLSWEEVEEEAEASDYGPGPRTERLWDEVEEVLVLQYLN